MTTTANAGAGSLRQAIAAADNSAGDDAINFSIAAGDAGCANGICTIRLTAGELALNGNTGRLIVSNQGGTSRIVISGGIMLAEIAI